MAEYQNSPVFANRYRFEPVGDDWDRGRSGFTHLVHDQKTERRGVIKRAETTSKQATDGLKNEVGALSALQGLGVPELYETGQTIYGSKNYFYIVIEYIDAIRIERHIDSLGVTERAEMLTQFFGLLAQAHRGGIVNGDVDLKHLFWRRDTKKLVVIDWGNAKLDIDPKDKTAFAYDLARSAEIIYSLITRQGNPPASGSIALPSDSALIPGLAPLPSEFRNLCKWAPRAPIDGTKAPHTAIDLHSSSRQWNNAVRGNKPPNLNRTVFGGLLLMFSLLTIVIIAATNSLRSSLVAPISSTPSQSSTPPQSPPTTNPTKTAAPTFTLTPAIVFPPKTYANTILVFDSNSVPFSGCWINETNSLTDLNPFEGFSRRNDGNWQFEIERNRTVKDLVQANFSQCMRDRQVTAVALNAWVARLEAENESLDHLRNEFGIFVENENGQRREYTLWIDEDNAMHLRIRENDAVTNDSIVLIVNPENLRIDVAYPRSYYQFPVEIFLEINNNGFDIVYLREGPLQSSVDVGEIDPSQMMRIDSSLRLTLSDIQDIGLVGYGGETQVIIWPLVFFEN